MWLTLILGATNITSTPTLIWCWIDREVNNYDQHKEKNNYSNRYDYAVSYLKKNYPEPSIIYGLSQSKDLTTLEWITDFIVGPGIIDMIHWLNEFAIWFLVEKETQSLLIKVTKEYIETTEISNLIDKKKFVHEKNKFIRLNKI